MTQPANPLQPIPSTDPTNIESDRETEAGNPPSPDDSDGVLDSLGKAISSPIAGAAEPDEESRDEGDKPRGA